MTQSSSARSDSGPCLQSDFSSVLLLGPRFPTLRSFGFPSGPAYPVPTPLPQPSHLVSSNPPKLPLACIQSSPLVSINTLDNSSQSPHLSLLLGSPVPLRVTMCMKVFGEICILPRNLAVPYWKVSQRLGLPPILTHADAVLANWKKRDPHGPFDMENLELLVTLPGGDSVRGFFMVTLLVELAAVPAIKSIPLVINGVQCGDAETVTRALEEISQAMEGMTDALKLMHAYVKPDVFYGIIRIYLSGWKDNSSMPAGLVYEGIQAEPMEYSGGSAAQSSLLHCFDELLGVKHEENCGAFLTRMRNYMPSSHKHLIQDISLQPSLRGFVQQEASELLTAAFQLCVTKLMALRSYHINVVSCFITVPAARARQLRRQGNSSQEETVSRAPTALEETGTGGSGIMSFLKTVRDRTRDVSLPLDNRAMQKSTNGAQPQNTQYTTHQTHLQSNTF
ncbi:indoleamine 2,3-dioxygenase 2-like isoform X1 [Oncorhynchus clarkii lewisi]|uniref:indoleamine 2,3-dioxygenase 2-like isoform X1 n=1 Tax=Oncorhynchus clarkii lewisi TaxID=490388 RepID=UPI0039B8F9B2